MHPNKLPLVLDFSSYVNRSTHDFTGREWIFESINHWLSNPDGKRFFTVTGEPGSGKTAVASYLALISQGKAHAPKSCQRLTAGFLNGLHFCSARDRHWINPRVFVESLSAQLSESVPGFLQAVLKRSGDRQVNLDVDVTVESGSGVGVEIHHLDLGEVTPEDAFARFIREPLEETIRGGHKDQIVLLIDALDEALLYSQEVGIPALLAEVEQLPLNVRFIVTTRPFADLLRSLRRSGMEEHSLTSDDGLQLSLSDVEAYCFRRASESEAIRRLLPPDISPAKFAQVVRDKSDGNFLFVTMLLQALEANDESISLASLESFPAGLDEFYLEFLDRLKKKRPEFEEVLRLLGVLTVNRQPLTEKQLSTVLGVIQSDIRKQLESVRQLLEEDSTPTNELAYALFHRSFIDFLLDADRAAEFWREQEEEHRRFVNAYFVAADPLTLKHADDRYLWDHLIHHLSGAHMADAARQLLLNFDFLEKKLLNTNIEAVLSDFDVLLADEALAAVRTSLVLASHVVREDPKHLKGQMLGRLLDNQDPAITNFTNGAVAAYKGEVGLRPLTPSLTRPAGPLRQTIQVSNLTAVEGVVLSSNAKWVLAILGMAQGENAPKERLICYQLMPSRVLYSLQGHTFESFGVKITQDEKIAVSAGRELQKALLVGQVRFVDGTADDRNDYNYCLRVWNLERQQEALRILCHLDHTRPIALAGNQVLAMVGFGKLKAWHLETAEPQKLPDVSVRWDRISGRGDIVAGVARLIERKTLKRSELDRYYSEPGFQPPSDFFLIPRENQNLKPDEEIEASRYGAPIFVVWNVNSPEQFRTFPGTWCDALDVAPDGSKLIFVNHGEVTVFDLTTGSKVLLGNSIEGLDDDKCYHYVSLFDGGSKAVCISGHYTSNDAPAMRVFSLNTGEELLRNFEHTTVVTALSTIYSEALIVTGSDGGDVRLWDMNTKHTNDGTTAHTRRINALCFSPDGRLACSASDDTTVGIWSSSDVKIITKLTGHNDRVNSVAFTLDGTMLISASSDQTIRVWKTDSFEEEKVLLGHERGVNAVAVHPDGKRFLSVSTDASIRWWDIKTGAFTFLYPPSNRAHVPSQLAFDGKGKRFAVGQGHGRDTFLGTADVQRTAMVVWDQNEKDFIASGIGWDDIEAVAMSRDGQFAYYTVNETVKKLRVEDNEELLVVSHDGFATGIAMSPDESYVVSVSRRGEILVWDKDDGKILSRFVMDTSLEACALSPDGCTLMVGDNAGQVHFFKLEGLKR